MTFRRFFRTAPLVAVWLALSHTANAQGHDTPADGGRTIIDILVPVMTTDEADASAKCTEESGSGEQGAEILVCGEPVDDSAYYFSGSRDAAEDRYAEETAFAGDKSAPDVAGPGIFTGPPTLTGLCGFIFNPCPPPAAYLIDFSSLPDAPPGSDADLISRGIPLPETEDQEESEEEEQRELSEFEKRELGLPPPLQTARFNPG